MFMFSFESVQFVFLFKKDWSIIDVQINRLGVKNSGPWT